MDDRKTDTQGRINTKVNVPKLMNYEDDDKVGSEYCSEISKLVTLGKKNIAINYS